MVLLPQAGACAGVLFAQPEQGDHNSHRCVGAEPVAAGPNIVIQIIRALARRTRSRPNEHGQGNGRDYDTNGDDVQRTHVSAEQHCRQQHSQWCRQASQ